MNLSMFMNNVTHLLHQHSEETHYSVNDIKSIFMAQKYVQQVLKLYGEKEDDILNEEAIMKISDFSLIHRRSA